MFKNARLLLIIFFCSSLSFAQCQSLPITIPFELIDNRPFILVYVNGKPLHFIFDTGAGNTIDKDKADSLGLHLETMGNEYGVGDNAARIWRTTADSVRVNPIILKDQSLTVISFKNIKEKLGLPYLDGTIGYPFMRNYVVKIDYKRKQIILSDQYDGKDAIHFDLYHSQIPFINVSINGKKANVIFDSGDRSYFTLLRHYADANNIYSKEDTTITGYGIGGPVYAQKIDIAEISVGRIKFQHVPSRIPVATGGGFAARDMDGSIGSGMVKNHVVVLDYKKRLFYVE